LFLSAVRSPPCACGLSLAFIKPENAMWSRLQITKRPCRTVIAAVMVTAFEDALWGQGGSWPRTLFLLLNPWNEDNE